MATFRYSAIDDGGERLAGHMEGADRQDILSRLIELGHHPVDVSEAPAGGATSGWSLKGRRTAGFSEISLFTRELAWLLKAGVNLSAALEMLAQESISSRLTPVIAEIRGGIRKGRSLHESLSQTGAFSQAYVSMIEIAEASGTLPAVLERIVESRDREEKIRRRIVSALIYPSLLVVLAGGAIVFIMIMVVPTLKEAILGAGGPVPEPARMVIGISDWLIANGLTVLAAVLIAILSIIVMPGRFRLRRAAAALAQRLPLIGSLIRSSLVLRFCRTLATLLSAGVGLPDSLKLMQQGFGNADVETVIARMETALRRGDDFLEPLEASKMFPKLLARMLKVGNETGNFTPSLQQATEMLQAKFEQTIDRVMALLEPAIILVLSAAVAWIIVSLMSAIVSINDLAV